GDHPAERHPPAAEDDPEQVEKEGDDGHGRPEMGMQGGERKRSFGCATEAWSGSGKPLLKLLWIKVRRIYNDNAIACDFPSIVFGACKVLDLASIFVEDVKAFCLT